MNLLNLRRFEIFLNPKNDAPEKIERGLKLLSIFKVSYAILDLCVTATTQISYLSDAIKDPFYRNICIIISWFGFVLFEVMICYIYAMLQRILNLMQPVLKTSLGP